MFHSSKYLNKNIWLTARIIFDNAKRCKCIINVNNAGSGKYLNFLTVI